MATNYEDVDVQCPFFIGEQGLVLRCEGLVGAVTLHRFKNSQRKADHMKNCCQNNYYECKLCRALDAQYDDKGFRK